MTEAIASETISGEFEGAELSFMNHCYNCRFHRHHWDGFLKRRCVAPDEIEPPRSIRTSWDTTGQAVSDLPRARRRRLGGRVIRRDLYLSTGDDIHAAIEAAVDRWNADEA